MYESPIEIMVGDMVTKMEQERERCVMSFIHKEGINVDRDELIKALRHDRNQYQKGYLDGKNDAIDEIRAKIVELQKDYHEFGWTYDDVLDVIDKYKAGEEKHFEKRR